MSKNLEGLYPTSGKTGKDFGSPYLSQIRKILTTRPKKVVRKVVSEAKKVVRIFWGSKVQVSKSGKEVVRILKLNRVVSTKSGKEVVRIFEAESFGYSFSGQKTLPVLPQKT